MMKNRKLSICLSVINVIGIICLIYYAILYISHNPNVVNPDAMLPMENWERAGMLLTLGFFPLLIANILGFLYVMKEKKLFIRLLFFIPSIIDICFVMHYWFF